MSADRYVGTDAARYLRQRFDFAFTYQHELEPLEDVVWERARELATMRDNLRHLARSLQTDADYVVSSLERSMSETVEMPRRGLWGPTERDSLHAMTERVSRAERELQAICAALETARDRLGAA